MMIEDDDLVLGGKLHGEPQEHQFQQAWPELSILTMEGSAVLIRGGLSATQRSG